MNTTLATERRHESVPPDPRSEQRPEGQQPQQVRRVGIIDRAALHLGVALIKWGRRPSIRPGRERRANRAELALLHRDRQFALASLASERNPVDYVNQYAPLR